MDPRPTRAETLPALYRAILDAVGELEARGDRVAAARARRAATEAYAVWDDQAERQLSRLLAGLDRSASAHPRRRIRPWSRHRRETRAAREAAAARVADGRAEHAPS